MSPMLPVFRPDAADVLKDDKARKSLKRYFAATEGDLPARFQVCKLVDVKADLSADDEELWAAHESGLKKFRGMLSKVDEGEVKLEGVKKPKISLLDLKIELAKRVLRYCYFCERRCMVDRSAGKIGVCGVGEKPRVASEFMHYGEEPELVPSYTIFFNGCTFKCVFCQNWDISQHAKGGVEASAESLAGMMENAHKQRARNINWVGGDPTPNLHAILQALKECKVSIPSVWNSNMYLSTEAMKLLFGTQDVYLTDFKYGKGECAARLSKVPRYFEVVARNHRLASADSELIIRHLVMPGHIECCSRAILEWISENLGPMVRVNIMDQYRVCYEATEFEEISRRLSTGEFTNVLEIADEVGLENYII